MGRGWRDFIAPHLGGKIDANHPSVLLCPADQIAPVKWESTSYSYSLAFYHSPEDIDSLKSAYSDLTVLPPVAQKPVNVAKPTGKILIGEWLSNHKQVPNDNDSGWWCREGKRNYLFADGQVRFLDANDIRPANDGNPNPNLTTHGLKGADWPR
jgi:prepilin-type processing-associated H-X9-DG protein